jgi:hypothetical protein
MASSCHRALLRGIPAIVLVAVLAVSGTPPALARAGDDRAALATERYYSSYGAPEPRHAPAAVAAQEVDGGGPTWTAAILGGVLVAIAAAGAGVVAGRSISAPRHAGA